MNSDIIIFSDGASKGNPGPGGWGAVVALHDVVIELGGREERTTNNRMELTGAIKGLSQVFAALGAATVSAEPFSVTLYTDSRYVINGITKWIAAWKQRDWKTLQKEDVINRDLWEMLDEVVESLATRGATVSWNYVGGHVGIVGNERVDEIASAFAEGLSPKLFSGTRDTYTLDISNISFDAAQKKEKKESSARSKAKAYSYISVVNGEVRVHQSWAECEARVKGVSGAKFKKSLSAEDEAAIIAQWSK